MSAQKRSEATMQRPTSLPWVRAAWAALSVGALVAAATPARADEIVYNDPDTCERKTIRAGEIVAETQKEIQYREKERSGPIKTVPTALVLEIRRTGTDAQAATLQDGIDELARGNVKEAREALLKVSGGGWQVDSEGKRTFTPFTANDPPGRGKRPSRVSEEAHFHYAKALVLDGLASKNKDILGEALLALNDAPVPGGDGKMRSGGFLGRFKDIGSRWLPEASVLEARALVGLGRYDDAAKVYAALLDSAVSLGLSPRWALEAKLGPGEIAEAQDKPQDAVTAYSAAADLMAVLLKNEGRNCLRREIGRAYSIARMRAAAVMLRAAEEHRSPSEFQALRVFIDEGTPEKIRKKFAGRSKPEMDALVAGAQDSFVQAVAQNGLGLAYFNEKSYDDAIVAFRAVSVKHFQVPDEPARALYWLAQAADAAAKQAKGEAARFYETLKEDAVKSLKAEYPNSPYATRK
jgi:tetratricopeptide (TPR) repeat protein